MYNNISCVVAIVFFAFVGMIFAHRSDIGRPRRFSNVSISFLSSVCFVPVTAKIPVCLSFHKSHICILHSKDMYQAEEQQAKISVQVFKSLLDE